MPGELEALLYQALASPYGIALSTGNFQLAQQRLYTARRGLKDPTLETLSFRRSPFSPETELWIIRNNPAPKESTSE